MGIRQRPPEKPDALVLYEQVRDLGIPLVDGGLMDQPHIWMMEYRICEQETQIFDALQQAEVNNAQHQSI